MNAKLFYFAVSLAMYGHQTFAQSIEVATNGVAASLRPQLQIATDKTALFKEWLDYPFYDWQAPDEEITTGLWIAKLFSRYQLSIPHNDETPIRSPIEFPTYLPPDFSIEGITYTNFHIRVTPFLAYNQPPATNILKCVLVSYFLKSDSAEKYVYSVYVNLNTGTGDVSLNSECLVRSTDPHFLLPILSSEDRDKQRMFVRRRTPSHSLPRLPPQPDKEIEVQTDL